MTYDFLFVLQAMLQKAGTDGVTAILEKLLVNIKFDILGTKIARVQVTEEAVLGKERPKYFYSDGQPFGSSSSNHRSKSLGHAALSKSLAAFTKNCSIDCSLPPIQEEGGFHTANSGGRRATVANIASTLSDFDMRIFEELEL